MEKQNYSENLLQIGYLLEKELEKMSDNISYWTEYNQYKKKFQDLYREFFDEKKKMKKFHQCFEVFGSIMPPQTQAEQDAFNDVRDNLYF